MNCVVIPLPVAAGKNSLCDGNHHRTGALPMSGTDLSHIWDKTQFMQFIRARFPQSAEYHLASLTGIPSATCRKHLYGETKPGADHVLRYLALFGPSLLVAVMGSTAPESVWRWQHEETRHDLELQAAKLAERLAEYPVG